jgi:hypothetical protein
MKQLGVIALIFLALSGFGEDKFYELRFEGEAGYIGFINHRYQSGDTGTNFNYITQGGQDILFPLVRFNAELNLFENHSFGLLYQPFEVLTTVQFAEDVTIDNKLFETDSIVDVRYSFPFWRLTYLYDFASEDNLQLEAGLALQFRNAAVSFEEITTSGPELNYANSQNLGPVPAIALRAGYDFDNGLSLVWEATGLFASSAFINGASFEFEGSILDTSLLAALDVGSGVETYLKLRFLGGSAVGNSEYTSRTWSEPETSYTANYLATWAPTVGFRLTL